MKMRIPLSSVRLDIAVLLMACTGLLAAQPAGESPAALTIASPHCVAILDPVTGNFSLRQPGTGQVFIQGGAFAGHGGRAAVVAVTSDTFGPGQGIEMVYPDGNRDSLELYPGLPFVLFHSSRHNGGAEAQVLNKVPVLSGEVSVGAPLAEVRTLGTGGLKAPAENSGSYAFLAIANPATRSGVVGGWLTQDRGSGVVFSPVTDGKLRLEARIDYGRLRIKPGADARLETFLLGWFDDARLGLEAYADAVAKVYAVKLPPKKAGFCTWYMEKHAGACDEVHLPEVSAVAARELKPFGFEFIQIDDQWQEGIAINGPKKNFTTHNLKGPYPSGMKAAADNIKQSGLVPGIWFMPFAGTAKDPWFAAHQDWFVKTTNGEPYDTRWGGTCLDMTNPDAKEYVRSVVSRIAHEWGYQLFKMDGYWTGSGTKLTYVNEGYVDDGMGDAVFADPDKTNIEALRDGTRLVRQAAGPDVFLLGCCISQNLRSFGGTFGLLDAMRVGPDTGGNIGSPHSSRVWFLNGRVWWNDPDCVFVRAKMSVNRARLNASWTTMADQLFYISDWLPETPADRLDIIKRCLPAHGLPSRPVDVFESATAKIWLLTDTRQAVRRDVVALYNWEKTPGEVSATTDKIGLPTAREYVGYDFWARKFISPFAGKIAATLPAESCRILAVRPSADTPLLISTSRHITQGIQDVTGEKWEASTLSGVSKIVANDPYELRIVVPVGDKSWRAAGVTVSPEDAAAGVTATFTQDGPKVRATVLSAASRDVKWAVRFEFAPVSATAPAAVKELQAKADYRGVALSWAADDAESYQVQRDDGVAVQTTANTFLDADIKAGSTYHYRVTALGWKGLSSPVATVEAVVNPLECPPTPPAPTVKLGDLKPVLVKNAQGKAEPNRSINGAALRVNGKTYDNGVGTQAPALTVYAIPAGAKRFVAVAGLDDEVKADSRASVVFQIFGDVKEMGEKPVLIAESPVLCDKTLRTWAFNQELSPRFKEIRLVVTDAGDGNAGDHGDWVEAGFLIAP